MTRKHAALCFFVCLVVSSGSSTLAGGRLEQIDITGHLASPIAGQLVAKVIGIQWDVRAIPVKYVVNNSLDPIPNPLGAPFLSVTNASLAFERAFNSWNNIPTSYMESHVVGTINKTTNVGFDMINELSFRTAASFNAIASSPSTTLIEDTTLVDGDDLDGDGDSDVSSAITQVTDVDNDGDFEFPAGFYKAGTILDNDVQFNTKTTNGLRFTVADADIDTVTRSVDLEATAVHEFGHSLGLSHVPNNQKNATDGTGATMFPFIDTGDPAAELSQRTLDSDDIAWASYIYPEGSASTGIAALQPGDLKFTSVYGVITGEVTHGALNLPTAGASVLAYGRNDDALIAGAFSGTTRLSFDPTTGQLFIVNDPAFSLVDGKYTIPVPKGDYAVKTEPVDGNPVPASSISFTAQVGGFFGEQNFNAEFFNRNKEAASEVRPGQDKNVAVNPGKTKSGIDIVTNVTANLTNFGNRNFIGFTGAAPALAGLMYAVRFPKAQVQAFHPGEDILIQEGLFDTAVVDASVPVLFAKAQLVSGTVDSAGNITSLDLCDALDEQEDFLAQDDNFAAFFFKNPAQLGKRVRKDMDKGRIEDLFLVLQVPTTPPFPGVSGQPPLIGLDGTASATANDVPIFGLSYTSDDGGVTWVRDTTFNYRFSLVLAVPPVHP
jgi:hypothetical protein